ncbi:MULTISPECIES: hypothetical protein [Achromobacter]|uniref:DUF3325 domain-containing protein n=1 Tax=Achromobacter spanius TaxID=217203 RepID=A0ABY8GLR6_9BURK|nr:MULTISPECIES: hypothetical protein [Achromobacter]WAI85189.1 hypothetical protein N8Z00_08980 [Achromobacter spanius]WEX95271.1 hypothetical protein N3Z32_03570 [Achromobacter sp. SS2-2022]WFP05559.1 hypothetical protein P8T11_14510 [Achromobacter spanius]
MQVVIPLSLTVMFLGCLCLYLASPNQRWRAAPARALPARSAGAVLLALSAWGCLHAFTAVAAVFVFCTGLMLCFSLIPYLGAFIDMRRRGSHEAG